MRRYRVQIAHRFGFHPRDLDEMTCQEFDEFARAVDDMAREEDRQRREAERQAPGRRSRR